MYSLVEKMNTAMRIVSPFLWMFGILPPADPTQGEYRVKPDRKGEVK